MSKDLTLKEWLGDSQLGTDIINKKYLQQNETFMEWAERVSGGNQDVKRLFVEQKFIPAGRILSNRGLNNKGIKSTLSNCYVLTVDDSIESIYECCSNMARTYSYGGGVGIDISKLRPSGAVVHNSARTTTGAVSFMRTFDVVTGTIGQNGRRGALMISLDVRHPDILEFVDIKANTDQITNANISVRVNDEFMAAVENDEDYLLHWPCEMDINKKELEALEYNKLTCVDTISGPVYLKKIKAKELFMKLAKNNWDYGEPGILYWDRIRHWNLMSENKDFEYAGVNPCVSGDTLILTKNGYQRIDSLVGKKIEIWNGYEWSEVEPRVTGYNQEMFNITFSNGCTLKCTKYHKFVLKGNKRVEANQLKVNDKLEKFNYPLILTDSITSHDSKLMYSKGFFAGDGYIKRENEPIIYLYGDKKKPLLPYIVEGTVREDSNEDRIVITIGDKVKKFFNKENKLEVPNNSYSISDKLYWLAGLIDADGAKNDKGGSITVTSINKEFLHDIQLMLHTLGVATSVNIMRKSGKRLMPSHDDNNNYKEYNCKEIYRLVISATNVEKLMQLGLNTHRVELNPTFNRDASRYITIKSIEDCGVCDTVYCFTERKNHTGIFGGVMTAQCAEEPLPNGGACLLGAINLYKYVSNEGKFMWDEFKKDVKTATIGLNEIQVEGTELHPLEVQRESAKKFRQIGLGIFDLGGALIKMGIAYGTPESRKIAYNITNAMLVAAFEQSCDLNTTGIKYPGMFESEFYKKQIEPKLAPEYKGRYPLNSQLLTIAPTGTTSTMVNATAGGGEPMFAKVYTRSTKSIGEVDYVVYPQAVLDYLGNDFDKNNLNVDYINEHMDKLPDYFVSADVIEPIDRILMQAALQSNIDASISSTINLPESATVQDVYDIYIKAWENGLKGVTVFRAGCKRAAILNRTTEKKENEVIFNTVNAPKRPKVLDGDYYQVKVQGKTFIIIIGLLDGKPYELFALPCDECQKVKNHKGKITRVKKKEYKFESDIMEIPNIAIALDTDYDINGEIEKISSVVNEGHKLTKGDVEIVRDSVYNIKEWSEKREYRNVSIHVSGNLRTGMRLEDIIKLEDKCNDNIVSFNKAIARVLSKYMPNEEVGEDVCPECGAKLVREEGCIHCPKCGWSKCG